jgi:hypothetical protein
MTRERTEGGRRSGRKYGLHKYFDFELMSTHNYEAEKQDSPRILPTAFALAY